MLSRVLMSVETTLLLSVAALYIVHCPFNKVEESFNTQAVHDVINLFPNRLPHHDQINDQGQLVDSARREVASRQQLPWDHILFPGVVPRTFVGALIVGLPLKVASYLMPESDEPDNEPDFTSQLLLQIGSRFALSAFLALSMSAVSRAVHKRYGLSFRICFILTTISQFHYMFYAGRFLPNTFAAILANLVFASWINRQYSKSIIYIAFCVIIFRFDTAIFFGALLFDAVFIKRYIPLSRVLFLGVPAGLLAILVTFSIDSIFWARPIWPELEGIYFNIWLNKSHLWGVQPYFWYIYNCIPRMLMAWAPFILLAEHRITRDYFNPILAFILIYSFLPHKELRFILFVTPFLNICVTSGLMNVQFYLNKLFSSSTWKRNRSKDGGQEDVSRSYIGTFLFIVILASLFLTNLFGCFVLSRISSHNYPGGQVGVNLGMTRELLEKAQQSITKSRDGDLSDPRSDVAVYVTNLAAQSGLSRFIQVDGVYYAKTPHLDANTFNKAYDLIYLILEPKEVVSFLDEFCQSKAKPAKELYNEILRKRLETKCNLPNQTQMYCSIISTTPSFKSVNIAGLIRKFKQINSIERAADSLSDSGFIETYDALQVVRCSIRSKHNPFS